jgi:hypothetical protein
MFLSMVFFDKFCQMVIPHKAIWQSLVKFGNFLPSKSPYYDIVESRANRHYDCMKGGNHRGVKHVSLKLVVIHFVMCWCRQLATSHPPPSPFPLHFLKLTSHLSIPYVNFYHQHAYFLSLLIIYILSIKLLRITRSSYFVVEDHRVS